MSAPGLHDDDGASCRYWAFISCSSKDKAWGRWLHRAIETCGIPTQLVSHPTPAGHPAPKRLHPLFRDRDELPASANLGAQIEEALRASRYLIAVCSPQYVQGCPSSKPLRQEQSLRQTVPQIPECLTNCHSGPTPI